MSQPVKKGLDFFPFDVDTWTDEKIRELEVKHGDSVIAFITKIFSRIYKDGYYFRLTEENILDFCSNWLRKTKREFDYMLKDAIDIGLFDEEKFLTESILTSGRIQRTYLFGTRRRKDIALFKEYIIEGVSLEKNLVTIFNTNGEYLYTNIPEKSKKTQLQLPKSKTKLPDTKHKLKVKEAVKVSVVKPIVNQMLENTPVVMPVEEVKRVCDLDYDTQNDLFKELQSKETFEGYQRINREIDEKYDNLRASINQMSLSQYSSMISQKINGKIPTEEEIYGGLRSLAGTGVNLTNSIFFKLQDHIQYYRNSKNSKNGKENHRGYTPENGYGQI